jgi:tetratricopeptide (TPR) repeat protein
VLFADLKGSLELILAGRDPEEARQLLDPVLERMMAAVHRYEGTVNQVMGDGIMALFGAPIAHEDHAVRACYAALAMQEAMHHYAAEVQRTHGVPLQAIAALPEEALQRGLAHLQATEFLYETRLFPDREYTFKHALTHEVAYGSLLQERRRALHARIVEVLEVLAGDRVAEQVEPLAHHALRGEVWDKALAYCRQAGEKAMTRSAHREAVGYFEQALRALAPLPETRPSHEQAIDIRLALRHALQSSRDFERILRYLHEAEALAEALDDARRLGQVCLFLSLCFTNQDAYDQAIATAQRALVLATAGTEVVLHAVANLYLGIAYYMQGDYRRARDCCRETVAFFEGARCHERFGLPFLPAVTSRAWLAVCHAELGMFAEGCALGDEGLRIAEAVAHRGSLMWAAWWYGFLHFSQGNLHRALPLLERAMGLCQDMDLRGYFTEIATVLGVAYTLSGRTDEAMSLLTPVLAQTMTTDRIDEQALRSLSLGEAHVLADHHAEVSALAERMLSVAREHNARGNQAYALRLLGEIVAHRAPPDIVEAAAHYRQALALAEELGMRPLQAHCHLGLGTLYATTGRREQARAELSTTIDLYHAMDMTFWLPQAGAALAQVEG